MVPAYGNNKNKNPFKKHSIDEEQNKQLTDD